MVRTVLFDLDGTLTDSREGILNCVRYALEKLGEPVPEEAVLLRFIGPPLRDSYARWCGLEGERNRRAVALFRERYGSVGLFENRPAPGVTEVLRRLTARGVTLALASSKPLSMCVPICDRFGFTPYLREIVGSPPGDDWEKEDVVREALRRLNAQAPDLAATVMVGDRKYDVEGAKACGLRCVGVTFFGYAEPGELEAAGAAAVVHTPEELERTLLSL